MNKTLVAAITVLLIASASAGAVDLGPFSIGFHLNPAVDAGDGPRAWGLSLSFGVNATVGDASTVDMMVIVDSGPSSLGLTVRYCRRLTEPFVAGAGLSLFWAFETEDRPIQALFGVFAHAAVHGDIFNDLRGEAGTSLPLITLAHQPTGWDILPLAELPSIHVAGEWTIAEHGAVEARATFQPVIVDTSLFDRPIGRLTDELLVLPTYSAFLRYTP